eukprot:gene31642-24552_t
MLGTALKPLQHLRALETLSVVDVEKGVELLGALN